MPGQSKEYEILFLLRAQTDASIAQMGIVQGKIRALEDQQQRYQETLKDISGYQKQTAELEKLREKQEELEQKTADVNRRHTEATERVRWVTQEIQSMQEAIDSLNIKKAEEGRLSKEEAGDLERLKVSMRYAKEELREATKEEENARRAKDSHQKSIDASRIALNNAEQKYRDYAAALKAAGVDTEDLDKAIAHLREEIEKLEKKQGGYVSFQNRIEEISNKARAVQMVANAAANALRPAIGFLRESLETASSLEFSMSAVGAISGATAEEMDRLTSVVKRMGATTIYTASESAGAMEKMALAGWDAEQMISGLPAVVKLAAAAGEDLASMTSIVSDGMNAFGLSGERAAVKFADVLAKAATSSNTTVGLLGQSLSHVQTTAANLDYSIEDISLALAAMANNALKGSISGTALNTILTRMSGANTTAKAQMEEMGLSMYDSSGQAKDLKTFLDELRTAFREFGDDAQSAQVAAYKLAGMRGMRGLLALVNQSDEQWQKLTDDIYAYAGAAEEISDVRMDNYTGQIYLLTSAWDALQTSVGEKTLPLMTELAKTGTDIVTRMNEAVIGDDGLVAGLAVATTTAWGTFKALSSIAGVIASLRMILQLTGMTAGPILATLGGVGAASIAVGTAVGVANAWLGSEAYQQMTEGSNYRQNALREFESTAEMIRSSRETIDAMADGDEKNNLISGTIDTYRGELLQLERTANEAQSKADALRRKATYIGADGEEVFDINRLTLPEQESMRALEETTGNAFDNMIEVRRAMEELQEERDRRVKALLDENRITSMTVEQYELMETAVTELSDAYAEAYQTMVQKYEAVFGLFAEVGEIEEQSTSSMLENLAEQGEYWERYRENLETIRTFADENDIDLSSLWGTLADGSREASGYAAAIAEDLESLPGIVEKLEQNDALIREIGAFTSQYDETVTAALEETANTIASIVEESGAELEAKTAMDATFDGYLGSIEENSALVETALRSAQRRWKSIISGGTAASANGYVSTSYLHGYASGTASAAPGAAIVGENGPELMYLRGGEQILAADRTRAALAMPQASGGSVSVNINVAGDASEATVSRLERFGENLRSEIRRVIREERTDARRRAFA